MNLPFCVRAFFALSLLTKPLFAQESSKADAPKYLTPESSLSLRSISDLQFSPDGSRLAFVVSEPPKGERRARHIWLYEKQSGGIRQFTYSAKTETSPRWSPDGKQLAFLSNRDEEQQIYVIRADGGEATALTKGKRSVQNFAWSPDGKQISFLAPDAKTEAEEKKEKDKDDAHVSGKEDKRARLWLLTLSTGETKALTQPNWEIHEAEWHPSGSGLTLIATDHPESDQETNRIFFFRLSDNSLTQVLAPHGPFGEIRIAPDGKTTAFVGCRVDGPVPHDLMIVHQGDRAAQNLTGASIDRPIIEYRWGKDSSLLAVIADGFRSKFVAFTPQGALQDVSATLSTNPGAFAVSNSSDVVFVGHTATTPQELWLWDQKSPAKQISHFNDS